MGLKTIDDFESIDSSEYISYKERKPYDSYSSLVIHNKTDSLIVWERDSTISPDSHELEPYQEIEITCIEEYVTIAQKQDSEGSVKLRWQY